MRVNVDMPSKVYRELDELSEARGKSKAQILRDAVSLEAWIDDIQKDGGRLLVERDGQVTEVRLR